MSYSIDRWKEQMRSRLPGWKTRMEQAGSHTIYGFLTAMSLWPLVEAARTDGLLPVIMTLGGYRSRRGRQPLG